MCYIIEPKQVKYGPKVMQRAKSIFLPSLLWQGKNIHAWMQHITIYLTSMEFVQILGVKQHIPMEIIQMGHYPKSTQWKNFPYAPTSAPERGTDIFQLILDQLSLITPKFWFKKQVIIKYVTSQSLYCMPKMPQFPDIWWKSFNSLKVLAIDGI